MKNITRLIFSTYFANKITFITEGGLLIPISIPLESFGSPEI